MTHLFQTQRFQGEVRNEEFALKDKLYRISYIEKMICGCLENISLAPGLSSDVLERLTKSRSPREQVERPARITASGEFRAVH